MLDRPGAVLAAAFALVLVIAALDYATGFGIRLGAFYLVPVALATWRVGAAAGAATAVVALLCWLLSFGPSEPYANPLYFYWDGAITFASLLVFVALLSLLRSSMRREIVSRHRDAVNRTARLIALGEFASAIAHELSQPLAAIGTYNDASLRLLEQGGADREALREAMTKARDQAKRAGSIVQRLRELLRQPVPALVEEDLNEVAKAALELARPEAEEAGAAVELRAGTGVPRVRGDRLLLEQVALNLVRNAIEAVQALPPERRRIVVSTAPQPGGQAVLSVCDEGNGVPAAARAHLFETFFTTKPGGLGLGLSICRSVVEGHGGTVRHEPNGARGACFHVSLPAVS